MSVPASSCGFGIDIGGSNIKGAPVNLHEGSLTAPRSHFPTPRPATPQSVSERLRKIFKAFSVPDEAPVGITFPGIIQHGVCRSAVNMDGEWEGLNIQDLFAQTLARDVIVVNDADAAGYAETHYGAAKGVAGMVLTITLGTGIGTAMTYRGQLIPNLELGHLEVRGHDIETRAAASVKTREGLSYEQWVQRLQPYFDHLEYLFSPDLFVIGGGISQDHEEFLPLLMTRAPLVPAQFFNDAGIVGAAAYAARRKQEG